MPEEVKLTKHEQLYLIQVTVADSIRGVLKEIVSYLERTQPSDTLRRELAPAVDRLELLNRSLEPLLRALGKFAFGSDLPDVQMFLESQEDPGTPAA